MSVINCLRQFKFGVDGEVSGQPPDIFVAVCEVLGHVTHKPTAHYDAGASVRELESHVTLLE